MEQTNTTTTRPTLLTVLCILTWVGTGIAIVSTGLLMVGSNMIGADGLTAYLGALLLCAALCLIGSIMMWKMKKTGFYLYVVGEIGPIILQYVVFKEVYELLSRDSNAMYGMVIGLAIPLAFVVMYALNLKHMK